VASSGHNGRMSPADALPTHSLGDTGLSINRLVLGTAPMSSFFWNTPAEQGVETAVAAYESGIRTFDTAPLYGLGEAETRLGEALARTGARDDVVIATKVGRSLIDGHDGPDVVFDFSADAVQRQLDASLERLQRDRVDIVHVHDPDDHLDAAVEGSFAALASLKVQGVVGAVSVGSTKVATVLDVVRRAEPDVVMIAGRLTLLDREAVDELLPECARRGVPVLAAGVFNSGVLARPDPGAWFDYAPALPHILDRAEALAAVCAEAGVSLRAAAMQFPLRFDGVAAVVVGMSSPAEVTANIADLTTPIPPDVWTALDALA
jgi:D-threo-aldose 1-dehydrogenase